MTNLTKTIVLRSILASALTGCGIGRSQPARSTAPQSKPVLRLTALELAWIVELRPDRLAGGIAADQNTGTIYALAPAFKAKYFKTCSQINSTGKVEREFRLPKYNMILRTARLSSTNVSDLLTFTEWVGSGLIASDTNGKTLWRHTEGQGINDVWAADLDGDGLDEVIVGYNGFTGIHVLDHRGKILWKTRQVGNVWHVSAADMDGDGKLEVICTSDSGKIAAFKLDGKRLPDIAPPRGYYADLLRPIRLSNSTHFDGILVTGASGRLGALRTDGHLAWELQTPPGPSVKSVAAAPNGTWLAVLCGSVLVVDSSTGVAVAKADGTGCEDLCWLAVKGETKPLLILKTRHSVEALRVLN